MPKRHPGWKVAAMGTPSLPGSTSTCNLDLIGGPFKASAPAVTFSRA